MARACTANDLQHPGADKSVWTTVLGRGASRRAVAGRARFLGLVMALIALR
jgi:hypothetical protein